MTAASSHDAESREIAAAVVAAYLARDTNEAALSAVGRGPLVQFLTRLMHDDGLFDAYCRAVTAERRRADVHLALLARGGPVPAAEEVARGGFERLSDDQLAELALSAEALEALAEHLFDPDLDAERGSWFFRSPVGDTASGGRRDDAAVPAPVRDGGPQGRRWLPSPAALLALAASVLACGVFLGRGLAPRGPSPDVAALSPEELSRRLPEPTKDRLAALLGVPPRREVVVASARTTRDTTRGPEDHVVEVTNADDRRAFVTVVGLVPGRRTAFHYREAEGNRQRYISLDPKATRKVILPDTFRGATVLLVALTLVPAGEPVREAVPPRADPARTEDVRAGLAADLSALGFESNAVLVIDPAAGADKQ